MASTVLGRAMLDVKERYTMGPEIGRTRLAVLHECTDKATGEKFTCKSIAKRKLVHKEAVEAAAREVEILEKLEGHPHIVRIRGAYEDKLHVHIVMERCAGGELFDKIVDKGSYSEKTAAGTFKDIMEAVQHCHSKGIFHRDLKPENFLLSSTGDDALLRLTDFGQAVYFRTGQTFTEMTGSAFYAAPEVLRKSYGPEADVWSCGIILYVLLCGTPPFTGETDKAICNSILKSNLEFSGPAWKDVSKLAKDLIQKILNPNPRLRITAADILKDPWLSLDSKPSDHPLDISVLSRFKTFSTMNKMKKLALKVIASELTEEEISGLQEMFMQLDTDGSGTITIQELKDGMKRKGTRLSNMQLQQLMAAIDTDKSGVIEYKEFVSATLQLNDIEKDEYLMKAFNHFDKDRSGTITSDELKLALEKEGVLQAGEVNQIIEEVDSNKDGVINYAEFLTMMKKGLLGSDGGSLS